MATTEIRVLTSGTTWTVPASWNSLNNSVACLGAGGGGGGSGYGGGGGAYVISSNITLTPGGTVSFTIGAGGGVATAGGDTTFNSSAIVAKGGSYTTGGQASASTGTTKYSGGNGGVGGNASGVPGGGGGGAASNSGAGVNGGDGSSSTGVGGVGGAAGYNTYYDTSSLSSNLFGKRYVGYFSDNTDFFKTATLHGDTNSTSSINGFNNEPSDTYSWMWLGWFKASATGTWTFYTNSDDASYLWLGDAAIGGYNTNTALVKNGGLHGTVEQSGTISLVSGQYYPMRIMFGENGGGSSMTVSFAGPSVSKTTNGSGYYYGGTEAWVQESVPPAAGGAGGTAGNSGAVGSNGTYSGGGGGGGGYLGGAYPAYGAGAAGGTYGAGGGGASWGSAAGGSGRQGIIIISWTWENQLPSIGGMNAAAINTALEYSTTRQLGLDDTDVRALASKLTGAISYNDMYGKSKYFFVNSTISTATANYNLSTVATAAGWDGVRKIAASITINSGIYLYGSTTSTAALTIGSLPTGSRVYILNNGIISGAGGAGGVGNGGNNHNRSYANPGSNGSPGGTAISTGTTTTIQNNGSIWGGGGGGGGGIGGDTGGSSRGPAGAGGGGGGAGYSPGAGGGGGTNGEGRTGAAGAVGTATAGGAGGASYTLGGAGGGPGVAGGSPYYAGGAAGYYLVGSSYVTFTNTGDVRGSSS